MAGTLEWLIVSGVVLDHCKSLNFSAIRRILTRRTRSTSDVNSCSLSSTRRHSFENGVQRKVLPFFKVTEHLK